MSSDIFVSGWWIMPFLGCCALVALGAGIVGFIWWLT